MRRSYRAAVPALLLAGLIATAAPARAQDPAPDPGIVTVTGGFDFVNQYQFRGIRQNSTGIAMWPWLDVGIAAWSGDGGVKIVSLNLGTWNSLHTGDTGLDHPNGEIWYESDFYATLGLGFGGGTTFATTYTSYTSPNDLFTHVKEVMFKLTVAHPKTFGMSPYAAVAFELGTEPGTGQADGGNKAGRYLELGIAPSIPIKGATLSVPSKYGFSLSNYYEHPVTKKDHKFGYSSAGAILTVPLASSGWNIHGGVEYQGLGTTTSAFNADDEGPDNSQWVTSIGFGFAY